MPLKLGEPLPSLDGATQWYNISKEEVSRYTSGKPLLIHFWSTSCYMCKNNFPALYELREKYASKGLTYLAVHFPRQEEDTNQETVQACMAEYKIAEPCAVDNQHLLKDAFKNDQGWVPAYFLFDAEGNLRGRAAGEAGIGVLTSTLQRLFPDEQVSA